MQHMLKSADARSGRCAVVLPLGVLFRGNREHAIRKGLIESDKIDTVIVLHDNLFYGTQLATCILFLRQKKPLNHKGEIYIIDASNIFTQVRAQNYLSEENVEEILSIYQDRQNRDGVSKIVSVEEIRNNDYSLSPKKYMGKVDTYHLPIDEAVEEFRRSVSKLHALEQITRSELMKEGYLSE